MGLHMKYLTVCCLVLDLDKHMDLILIPMKILNYDPLMGKCLVQDLGIMKKLNLVHMVVQS